MTNTPFVWLAWMCSTCALQKKLLGPQNNALMFFPTFLINIFLNIIWVELVGSALYQHQKWHTARWDWDTQLYNKWARSVKKIATINRKVTRLSGKMAFWTDVQQVWDTGLHVSYGLISLHKCFNSTASMHCDTGTEMYNSHNSHGDFNILKGCTPAGPAVATATYYYTYILCSSYITLCHLFLLYFCYFSLLLSRLPHAIKWCYSKHLSN